MSRKMIIDHMQKNCLVKSSIELKNKCIKSVNCGPQRYHIDFEQQKKKAKSDVCNQQLEILKAETNELTQRKLLSVGACKQLDNQFIQVIREAEDKNDIKLVIKGNARIKLVLWKSQSKFWKQNEERLSEK